MLFFEREAKERLIDGGNPKAAFFRNVIVCSVLLFPAILFLVLPNSAWSQVIMNPVYHLLFSSIDTNKKVFIIGDSTVHRHLTPGLIAAGITCGADNPDNVQQGWADRLGDYMIHPENSFNRARQGASTEEYKTAPSDPDVGVDRNWQVTKQMMEDAGGGILLIQFGSGNEKRLDPDPDVRQTKFKDNLKFYIAQARAMNVLPILVTPPEGRRDWRSALADGLHPQSRVPYPEYIQDVAASTNTEMLDLTVKSNNEFAKYSDAVMLREFGNCRYRSGYWDRVHYEPQGAQKVAGWVKELACTQLTDKSLCAQFSTTDDKVIPEITLNGEYGMTVARGTVFTDPGATAQDDRDGNISAKIVIAGSVNTDLAGDYTITYDVVDSSGNAAIQVTRRIKVVVVHEDAEDGDTVGWATYATTAGSTISNVFDEERQSRVIVLQGNNGLDNGFSLDVVPAIVAADGFVVSWAMNFNQAYKFMVKVRTDLHDPLYVYYGPDTLDRGYEFVGGRHYIHTGLGTVTANGRWRTFTRDIKADLKRVLPDDVLQEITGFRVRGSGRVDDITTQVRPAQNIFYFNAHKYEIVKTARSWQDARDAAHLKGGYLTTISSRAENHEIYSRLYRHITAAEYADTVAPDGGGASYVWIGANDLTTEKDWRWEKYNQQFWDDTLHEAVSNRYNKWGRGTDETRHEPDDWNNSQDAGAMALTEWQKNNDIPAGQGVLGQASQWNDLVAADELFYIIEYE